MKSGFTAISTEYVDIPSQRRTLRWPLIVLAICVIAPASLFLHDYRLETLKVPYPNFVGIPNWVKFVNEVVRLFTLAALAG